MRIISRKRIREASASHSEWKASLEAWHRIAKAAEWDRFVDVRRTFNSADSCGDCVIFDIGNNKCRLIAYVNYRGKRLYILHILSHKDYDKDGWKDDCHGCN